MPLTLNLAPRRFRRVPLAHRRWMPEASRREWRWVGIGALWVVATYNVARHFGLRALYAWIACAAAAFAVNRFLAFRRDLRIERLRREGPRTGITIGETVYPPRPLAEAIASLAACGSNLWLLATGARPLWWHTLEFVAGLGVAATMMGWNRAMQRDLDATLARIAERFPNDPVRAARRTGDAMRDPSSWISAPPPDLEQVLWTRERAARRAIRG